MKKIVMLFLFCTLLGCAYKAPIITDESKYFSNERTEIEEMKLVELKTREYSHDQVHQKFAYLKPKNSVATLLLFEGGSGTLDLIEESGQIKASYEKNGFLVRNYEKLAKHGFTVALLDSPSDIPGQMNIAFRESQKHTEDLDAVLSYLKKKSDKPIWVVSMFEGTISNLNLIENRGDTINGAIFLSAISHIPKAQKYEVFNKKYPKGITDMVKNNNIPTLMVHHKQDQCKWARPYRIDEIMKLKKNKTNIDVLFFDGGCPSEVNNETICGQASYHGFHCIDEIVIENIAGFIKENL